MRLLQFRTAGGPRVGVRRDGGVLDATAAGLVSSMPTTVEAVEALARAADAADGPLLEEGELALAPALATPSKIICVGLNYRRHAIESNQPIPTVPVLFAKFPNGLAGSGQPVAMPTTDEAIDYEAELAVVIGRRARDVPESRALDHVLGYACANDLSARTLQLATSQWVIGKMLDGFLPVGPWLVTADEVPDPQALGIRCFVNGEKRQDSNTADMIFPVAEIVSYLSRHATLEPGDLIITGTPEGVALGMKEKKWLRAGDEVTIEIDGLGRLTNRLV